jgi:hypothetical protein
MSGLDLPAIVAPDAFGSAFGHVGEETHEQFVLDIAVVNHIPQHLS